MGMTSIIIPTFNECELLQQCIYSIKRHTVVPYEIIVVDNGSHDGTVAYCDQEGITLVSLQRNVGFPAACNLGLQIASGEQLLLLNNDVLVTNHWLDNMLACLHSDENIGVVGPTSNYAGGEQQVPLPCASLSELDTVPNISDARKWRRLNRIVGLCFLFRRSLMDEIGLLDERFAPGHYEDDDYCYRAALAGYHHMLAGDVFIYHHGSVSFRKQGVEQLNDLVAINKRKFEEKWGVQLP